jgi:hypothetical protein
MFAPPTNAARGNPPNPTVPVATSKTPHTSAPIGIAHKRLVNSPTNSNVGITGPVCHVNQHEK